jgi:hypothetical protein
MDAAITSSVDEGHWKYYVVSLPSLTNQLFITVNITSSPIYLHDCDVYVKYNSLPSLTNTDYVDAYIRENVFMEIPMARAGNWYIGVWGFKQCDYLMKVSSNTQQCVSQCSQHGQCVSPNCVCQYPFSGQYCENKTIPLNLNEQATGYLDQNIWNYYTFFEFSSR